MLPIFQNRIFRPLWLLAVSAIAALTLVLTLTSNVAQAQTVPPNRTATTPVVSTPRPAEGSVRAATPLAVSPKPATTPTTVQSPVVSKPVSGSNYTAAIKQEAIDLIGRYGPKLEEKVASAYYKSGANNLVITIVLLMVLLPLAGFFAFVSFPLYGRGFINRRVAQAPKRRLAALYLVQALNAMLALFILGFSLCLLQFISLSTAALTNPKLIIERAAIDYIVSRRAIFVNGSSNIFVGVARDISEPKIGNDFSVFALIIDNARELRQDGLVSFGIDFVKFIMPVLGYVQYVAIGLLIVFFFRRIWPDIKGMIKYPIEVLKAEQENQPLPIPQYGSIPLNTTRPGRTGSSSMWKAGLRLTWIELRLLVVFIILAFVITIVIGLILQLLALSAAILLINTSVFTFAYFVSSSGAAALIIITLLLLAFSLVEIIMLFGFTYSFMLGNLTSHLRNGFAKNVTWRKTGRAILKNLLRSAWIIAVATTLCYGLIWLANQIVVWEAGNNPDNPNWLLVLLVGPGLVLVGLNLGMWLLRGFRLLRRQFNPKADVLDVVAAGTVSQVSR